MCKYCEKKKEVGALDDYYHADDEIAIGLIGGLLFQIIQFGNTEWDPHIEFNVEFHDDKDDHYTTIFNKGINISYCPFCGRKLRESE